MQYTALTGLPANIDLMIADLALVLRNAIAAVFSAASLEACAFHCLFSMKKKVANALKHLSKTDIQRLLHVTRAVLHSTERRHGEKLKVLMKELYPVGSKMRAAACYVVDTHLSGRVRCAWERNPQGFAGGNQWTVCMCVCA